MTWSLVNTIATEAAVMNKSELSSVFTYFYETFLPTRGWTVTPSEFGGNSLNSEEEAWGISKDFTFADGVTITRNLIHEVEYSQGDMNVWDWDGTPGAGIGSMRFADTTWIHGLRSGVNNYHFLASDENLDSWCVIANKRLIFWSHPSDGMYTQGATDTQRFNALGLMACFDVERGVVTFSGSGVYMYHGQGNTFYLPAYLMTPAFSFYGTSGGTHVVGQNTATDLYSRFTNSTNAHAVMACEYPSSVLIDGDYYLDLWPASTGSLLLKTGATNLGVLL
jgi:hypothetical protein